MSNLRDAAEAGNLKRVQVLMEQGVDMDKDVFFGRNSAHRRRTEWSVVSGAVPCGARC